MNEILLGAGPNVGIDDGAAQMTALVQDKMTAEGLQPMQAMEALNAEGDVLAWAGPYVNGSYLNAYNPARVKVYALRFWESLIPPADRTAYVFTVNGTVYYYVVHLESWQTVELTVKDKDNVEVVTLEADMMKGEAVLDVAPVAVCMLEDAGSVFDGQPWTVTREAPCLLQKMQIAAGTGIVYYFMRGVSQIGRYHPTTLAGLMPYLLNRSQRVWLDGVAEAVPQVVLVGSAQKVVVLDGVSVTLYPNTAYVVPMTPENVAALNAELPAGRQLTAVISYVDCQAVAVRWLNSIGGIETFVFAGVQYETRQHSQQAVRRYARSGDDYGQMAIYGVKGSGGVRVGIDNCPAEQYKYLRGITLSPDVAVYDREAGCWIQVYVKDWKGERRTDSAATDLEIELTFPDNYTQQW